jgi:hypothetical protein
VLPLTVRDGEEAAVSIINFRQIKPSFRSRKKDVLLNTKELKCLSLKNLPFTMTSELVSFKAKILLS